MTDRKHILGTVAVFLGVTLFGSLALAWPGHRQTRLITGEIEDLRGRIELLDASTAQVALLEARLHVAQRRVNEELKVIADSADLADLVRRLSLPVDHDTVIDQTFTAGSPYPIAVPENDAGAKAPSATPGGADHAAERPMAVPVTIELVGTFQAVHAILVSVESMNRLSRIGTLRINCERSGRNESRAEPVLHATIGLEAIYAERGGANRR